jgi:hypothetical protein
VKKAVFFLFIFLLAADTCLAGVSVIGELARKKTVRPGERYEGVVTVKNSGDTAAEVRLYQTDYLFYADGRNIYGEPGSAPRSNAPWITAGPTQLTVPPKGTSAFHYTVKVPENNGLKGSFWSLLMVEPLAPPPPETEGKKGKVSVGLQTVIRYAVQIVTDIEESGERKIAFLNRQLTTKDGKTTFSVDIGNSGERRLSPVVWMDLYSAAGTHAGRFDSGRKGLYPECSVRNLFDLTEVPSGTYSALVVVDNEDDHVFGGQYEIVIK